MNKAGLLLLVGVVAVGGFLAGRLAAPGATANSESAQPPAPGSPVAIDGPVVSPEPPRTYRGPDGYPHLIDYGPGNISPSLRAAVLADMRNHPRNIARDYGLPVAVIQDIANGRRKLPEALLPGSGTTSSDQLEQQAH